MAECDCCQDPPLVYRRWMPMLEDLDDLLTVTVRGGIVVLAELSTEDFVVLSLSGAFLAHRCGRRKDPSMTTEEILSAGGVLIRPTKQKLSEELAKLGREGVVREDAGRFSVDERIVLQVHARRAPQIRAEASRLAASARPRGSTGS